MAHPVKIALVKLVYMVPMELVIHVPGVLQLQAQRIIIVQKARLEFIVVAVVVELMDAFLRVVAICGIARDATI
jgi:hypothetical protein